MKTYTILNHITIRSSITAFVLTWPADDPGMKEQRPEQRYQLATPGNGLRVPF
jgi:hypothetical protein